MLALSSRECPECHLAPLLCGPCIKMTVYCSSACADAARRRSLHIAGAKYQRWGQLFHNAAAATAIADRLVHKGLLVRILGASVRPPRDTSSDDAA